MRAIIYLVALVNASLLGCDSPETEVPYTRGPQIAGFESFLWGTPADTVLDNFGAPEHLSRDRQGRPLMAWYKGRKMWGRPAEITISFIPGQGLVAGRYFINLDPHLDCEAEFERVLDTVRSQMPGVFPETFRRFDWRPLCVAAQVKDSMRAYRWIDPSSGSQVHVKLLMHRTAEILYFAPGVPTTWPPVTFH